MKFTLLITLNVFIFYSSFSQCVNPNLYSTTFSIVNIGATLTNKTVKVLVNTQQLISLGQSQLNGSDIRFGTSCCNLYTFWIDTTTINTTNTAIWVRIPVLPASSTFTLSMFHGSSTLSPASNFNLTFPNRYILTSGIDSLYGAHTYDWFEVRSSAFLKIGSGQLLNINAESIKISGTVNGAGKGQPGDKTTPCTVGLGLGGGLTGAICANGGGAGYGGLGGCAPAGGASSCAYGSGPIYGTTTGTDIDMGSSGSTGSGASSAGNGAGNGGGGIRLSAASIYITGVINVSGQDGEASASLSNGGGGGSGGGILINGLNINLSGASLIANGGRAGNRYGGAGAGGRIKIFRKSPVTGTFTTNVNGSSQNTYTTTLLLSSAIGASGTYFQDSINTGILYSAFVSTVYQPCGILYFSKSTGVLNDTLSWTTNINGTGSNPPNFSTAGAMYYVVNNATPTISSNWFVTGLNSLVIFGDGINSGNFALPTSITFGADSFYVNKNYTLTLQGQLIANKPAFDSVSTAQYISASTQNIIAATYGNLVVSGGSKTLTGNTIVTGVLAMFNNINCNGNTLSLGISSSQPGTLNRSSGTITGNFTRWFTASVNSGSSGLFPIGSVLNYRPIQVNYTSSPSSSGTISAEFINTIPGNAGFPLFDFTTSPVIQINKCTPVGFWRLTPGNGLSGGTYTCTATGSGITGVSSVPDLRLVRRSSSSSSWALTGSSVLSTGSIAAPVVSRTSIGITGGEFAIASDSTINILPVKLIYFKANAQNNDVNLQWATASELNTMKYEVEKQIDNNWQEIGNLNAVGSRQKIIQYDFIDRNAFKQNSTVYYRLKIIDTDGRIEYSQIISASIKVMEEEFTINPNPFSNKLTIQFKNHERLNTNIEIYDINGTPVIKEHDITIEQMQVYILEESANLMPGMYYIKVLLNNQWHTQKIIKF